MSKIPTAERVIVAGKLKTELFKTEQARLEGFCEAMSISVQAGEPGRDGVGKTGAAGPAGEAPTKNSSVVDIPISVSQIECGVLLEDKTVNIINSTETPTVGLLAISGSTAFLTGATPTANYKVKITY